MAHPGGGANLSPRDTHEPTGKPESLWGKVDPKSFGDHAYRDKPPELEEKLKKSKKKKEREPAFDAAPPRSKKTLLQEESVLTSSEEGVYQPKTKETRAAYEAMLSVIQQQLGGQPLNIVSAAADEILTVLKNDNIKNPDKKKEEIEKLLNPIPNNTFDQLVSIGKLINGYHVAGDAAAANGDDGLDDDVGVAVEFEENEEEEEERYLDMVPKDEEGEDDMTEVGGSGAMQMGGGIDDDDEERDAIEGMTLNVQDIDVYWLQRKISQAYDQNIDPRHSQKLAEEVLKILAEGDDREVENKLLVHLQFDKFSLIKYLLRNRLKVVWCNRMARAEDQEKRKEIEELSDLQKLRSQYQPELPPCLQGTTVRVEFGDATTAADPLSSRTISRTFPHTYGQPIAHFLRATSKVPDAKIITEHPAVRVGVVFCGRQSPGGLNVIWGLHDALKVHNPKNTLFRFLGGSDGLFAQKILEITDDILATYKNQGGYDLLGRTKIRTAQQVNSTLNACKNMKLDALVIIGGVTSNTDAAQLAEIFAKNKCSTKVVGIPVSLNGDLKNQFVETNVGFDTICKVNSQLISNVCTDALSAEKYYYFIRLVGRKASHVALECTLQSHPNMVILAEEVAASKLTLFDITKQICDAVQARGEQDKHHGVILLPEGLIESIPEVHALLQEIHRLLREGASAYNISCQLSPWASALFGFLPLFMKRQLLLHPESDETAQLSQNETEKLLAELVVAEMNKRLREGTYKGKKFNAICRVFGYQARGSLPSKFDCDYAYVLGHIGYHIIAAGLNGYMATVNNLKNPVNKWRCGAAPITAMLTVEHYGRGQGASNLGKPALHPATVDLKGKGYELLRQNAIKFLMDDVYRNPGSLQFDGPGGDAKPVTLCVEDQDYTGRIQKFQEYLDEVRSIVKPGCSQDVLKAALSAMTDFISVMSPSSGSSTI
ncbi:hypothetical protein ACS0TY_030553 [Phlomoides rotata]